MNQFAKIVHVSYLIKIYENNEFYNKPLSSSDLYYLFNLQKMGYIEIFPKPKSNSIKHRVPVICKLTPAGELFLKCNYILTEKDNVEEDFDFY
jgi:hypothetical protein